MAAGIGRTREMPHDPVDGLPMSPMSTPLDPHVIQRFLELVVSQLRATVGVEAVILALGGDAAATTGSLAVTLEFRGDVRGPVTWVFPQPIALELVSRLMADPAPDPDLATDGASELANILTGHASAALETHGLHCEFGAPCVHEGSLPGGTAFRMTTSAGPIDVIFSMRSDRAVAS